MWKTYWVKLKFDNSLLDAATSATKRQLRSRRSRVTEAPRYKAMNRLFLHRIMTVLCIQPLHDQSDYIRNDPSFENSVIALRKSVL
jgi:hypothetical protein